MSVRVLPIYLLLGWSIVPAQVRPPVNSAAADSAHPVSETRLAHFEQIDDGVYKGSTPRTDADFRFLQSKRVKSIVVLHFWPLIPCLEKRKAREYGISVIPIFLQASPFQPSEDSVNRVLQTMRDPRYLPVYVHCTLGRDRASLVAALYQVYFRDLPKEDALPYMKQGGFREWPGIRGLRRYLESHLNVPASLSATSKRESAGMIIFGHEAQRRRSPNLLGDYNFDANLLCGVRRNGMRGVSRPVTAEYQGPRRSTGGERFVYTCR
jgi:hypothetical protein